MKKTQQKQPHATFQNSKHTAVKRRLSLAAQYASLCLCHLSYPQFRLFPPLDKGRKASGKRRLVEGMP